MRFLSKKTFYVLGTIVVLGAAVVLRLTVFGAAPPPRLVTAQVSRADIEDSVLATGAIEALKQVSVGAQVSGQITSLKVHLGDRVKKGDLIAEIDYLSQQNSLRTAEASLANTRAQLESKKASLRQAELAFARQRQMMAQDATSRESYESAEATLNVTRAEIKELEAQITQSAISVDTAKLNLGYTKIRAPMDGTVVAIVAKEGQTVNANQSTPTIIKLAKLDTVTVKAEISEADVTRVKPGLKVYFTILGAPDKRYTTTLREVEPAPDSISSDSSSSSTSSTSSSSSSSSSSAIYYNGLLDVPNPDGILRISMTTEVHIVLGEAKNVLSIPSTALGARGADGSYEVRVQDRDGKVSPRSVKIGLNNNVVAQVLNGLREDEEVVLAEASASAAPASRRMGPGGPPPM
ncbi:efflux RND transporter periplasmic adaptor subunit [Uliginosibacterium gangwonense]|uniref:efflux RND transporter periplasmic adaptor subunit n=1 Tax=Uliginosibacterium gangwonense TaxID=392736 RepID=UPI0005247C6B|nr:efflux RND transporter periplasmic adaptor subunit [Uliginosibacterium gangwonense]